MDAAPVDQHVVESAPLVLQTLPYTTYMVSVAAETVVGQGPFSTEQIVVTPEDGKSTTNLFWELVVVCVCACVGGVWGGRVGHPVNECHQPTPFSRPIPVSQFTLCVLCSGVLCIL